MKVRAKFRVTAIKQTLGHVRDDAANKYVEKPLDEVEFGAVTDDANKTWSQYTPSGSLKLCMTNPEATGAFEIGKFYFLDFTPAPAAEKDE